MPSVAELTRQHGDATAGYSYAFLDGISKREIRRSLLKAVAIPGYQVPFGSRELPIARGWGTGGLQITLAILGPGDVVKMIDQGDDASVNAANLRRLVERTTGLRTTFETAEATIVQSRHRIPEVPLRADQTLVLQCPTPEPLRAVEPSMAIARRMHAEGDYARMWVSIYEGVVRRGELTGAAGYPVMVNGRYVMAPTPIPRWDIPKLDMAPSLLPAAFRLAREGLADLPGAVRMVTLNAARAVGLRDRGALTAGQRADLILVRLVGEVPHVERAYTRGRPVFQFASVEEPARV